MVWWTFHYKKPPQSIPDQTGSRGLRVRKCPSSFGDIGRSLQARSGPIPKILFHRSLVHESREIIIFFGVQCLVLSWTPKKLENPDFLVAASGPCDLLRGIFGVHNETGLLNSAGGI